MKKNKNMEKMQKALSSLDSVLTALDAYPDLEDAILNKVQGEMNKYLGQLFPTQLDFSKELLEHLVGTDVLIDIISSFLVTALPGVEVALKASLLANMQNLGTNCTIDPFIYEKAIKEGIIFDLRQIDLYDKLNVSPLDKKIGEYFYFGIEDCESSYDVLWSAIDPNNQTETRKEKWAKKHKNTDGSTQKEGTSYMNRALNDTIGHYFGGRKRDFDCLLWYMKNKSVTRQVWGKRTSKSEDIFNGNGDIGEWLKTKGNKKTTYYSYDSQSNKITIWTYNETAWGSNTVNNKPVQIESGKDKLYYFTESGKAYVYKEKINSISKLSRKKIYCKKEGTNTYSIYSYDDKGVWKISSSRRFNAYEKIEDAKDKVVSGDFIIVDDCLKRVTNPEKLKTEECIDITDSLRNNLCLYVDYDELQGEDTKGQIIKNGGTPLPSLGGVQDIKTIKKSWVKEKIDEIPKTISENEVNADDEKNRLNLYYRDNIDNVVIPPHDTTKFYVNISAAQEKDNKYTKEFGIVTLEYSPRTGNLIQSDGNPMHQQTPYDNVLHVFFGNVKELNNNDRKVAEDAWINSSNINKDAMVTLQKLIRMRDEHLKFADWQSKIKIANISTEDFYKQKVRHVEGLILYKLLIYGGKADAIEQKYLSDNFKTIDYKTNIDSGELSNEKSDFNDIEKLSARINKFNDYLEQYVDDIYSGWGDASKSISKRKLNKDVGYNHSSFLNLIRDINKNDCLTFSTGLYSITTLVTRINELMNIREDDFYLKARNATYPEAKKNYYLKRTLFEFNVDYINSLQLFDPKVLAAQIITSIFGGLTVTAVAGMTASWKTDLIRDVVKDMVQKEIAAEDYSVSDCFFTFTNDAYNGMLRAADLRQAGLYSAHGEENGNNKIDITKMLEGLNEMSNCADQAGQTEVIKGVITTAAGEVSKDIYNENNHLDFNANFGIQMSFIETMMINLCTQLVMAMLSPKVYLLILINLEMFGLSTNFDLKAFIERFNALIRSIVKSVVDQFMSYLSQKIMEIIMPLIGRLIAKLGLEQIEMYARLIKQILNHLSMFFSCGGNGEDWTQDMIGYADIVNNEAAQEPIDEC